MFPWHLRSATIRDGTRRLWVPRNLRNEFSFHGNRQLQIENRPRGIPGVKVCVCGGSAQLLCCRGAFSRRRLRKASEALGKATARDSRRRSARRVESTYSARPFSAISVGRRVTGTTSVGSGGSRPGTRFGRGVGAVAGSVLEEQNDPRARKRSWRPAGGLRCASTLV